MTQEVCVRPAGDVKAVANAEKVLPVRWRLLPEYIPNRTWTIQQMVAMGSVVPSQESAREETRRSHVESRADPTHGGVCVVCRRIGPVNGTGRCRTCWWNATQWKWPRGIKNGRGQPHATVAPAWFHRRRLKRVADLFDNPSATAKEVAREAEKRARRATCRPGRPGEFVCSACFLIYPKHLRHESGRCVDCGDQPAMFRQRLDPGRSAHPVCWPWQSGTEAWHTAHDRPVPVGTPTRPWQRLTSDDQAWGVRRPRRSWQRPTSDPHVHFARKRGNRRTGLACLVCLEPGLQLTPTQACRACDRAWRRAEEPWAQEAYLVFVMRRRALYAARLAEMPHRTKDKDWLRTDLGEHLATVDHALWWLTEFGQVVQAPSGGLQAPDQGEHGPGYNDVVSKVHNGYSELMRIPAPPPAPLLASSMS